jgi:diguanylate cyclase (GGDEF)-like protein/PAS domain S-box-containing protein
MSNLKSLMENNTHIKKILDSLNVAIMVIDRNNGTLLYVNKQVCSDIQKTCEELTGMNYRDIFWTSFTILFEQLAAKCDDRQVHTNVYNWQERTTWEQIACRLIPWPDGRTAYLLSITNVTEVCQSEFEYKQLAFYDELLQLPNGVKLEKDIEEITSYQYTALIHFDIDHFAGVNEIYGWETGNNLLKQIRDWLRGTMRGQSQLYRVNDDEFCVLMRDVSVQEAKERAQEILDRFTQPWIAAGENDMEIFCNIALGLVYGKNVKGDLRNLLYRTINSPEYKNDGYIIYDEQMDQMIKERLRLRQNLINCISQDMKGFSVHYHPIVNARTEEWVGAEALCRWTIPGSGTPVSPLFFIEEAEKIDLIGKLDRWVCETAMRQCKEWDLTHKNFYLNVNISPVQPINQAMIKNILDMLDRVGYPKEKLNLELTESNKVVFSEATFVGLQNLKDEGIVLTLDDFGTGYSMFDTLVRIPASVLKTEKSFINDIENDEYLQYLMRVLIDMAHKVDMVLVAEGVETVKQKELLKSFGVDYMQGYLFSKPLPKEMFEKQLHRFK